MSYGIIDLLQIIGSLALFIYGMHLLSNGLQKAAGARLRQTLRNLTKNPINGILVGSLTTAILQTSSAVTVMIVSFVNGGLITAAQSFGLIMGANIGTTVTAWIVALGGFLFKLKVLVLPMLAIAVPAYFKGKESTKYWSEFVIGLALLLLGLDFLKISLPTLQNEDVYSYVSQFTSLGLLGKFLFVIIGIALTIIIQSSSATMTLTLALVFNGWLPMEDAAYMILGENIGTCITAEFAAIVGNREARLSARLHSIFNIVGVAIVFLFVPMLISLLGSLFDSILNIEDSFGQSKYQLLGLAAFHTTFNILNTAILLPLSQMVQKVSKWTLLHDSSSGVESGPMKSTIRLTELSPIEIQLEIAAMSRAVLAIFQRNRQLFKSVEQDESHAHIAWIMEQRGAIKDQKNSLDDSILKLSKKSVSKNTNESIISFLNVNNDLMRVYELTRNLTHELKDKNTSKIWLTPVQRATVLEMYSHVEKTMQSLNFSLNKQQFDIRDLQEIVETESKLNKIRDKASEISDEMQQEFHFNIKGTLTYIKLVSILEKIGDKCHDIADKIYHSN